MHPVESDRSRKRHGGGSSAGERGQLLAEQRRKRLAEHRRQREEREAAKASTPTTRAPARRRATPARPPHVGAHVPPQQTRTARARTVMLGAPVMIGPNRRTSVVGYTDPPGPPAWLRKYLEAAA